MYMGSGIGNKVLTEKDKKEEPSPWQAYYLTLKNPLQIVQKSVIIICDIGTHFLTNGLVIIG